jgi:hypothetical protein
MQKGVTLAKILWKNILGSMNNKCKDLDVEISKGKNSVAGVF